MARELLKNNGGCSGIRLFSIDVIEKGTGVILLKKQHKVCNRFISKSQGFGGGLLHYWKRPFRRNCRLQVESLIWKINNLAAASGDVIQLM
jgi:hypothetical protein